MRTMCAICRKPGPAMVYVPRLGHLHLPCYHAHVYGAHGLRTETPYVTSYTGLVRKGTLAFLKN